MTTSEPRFRRYAAEVRAQMLVEAGLACLASGGIRAFTVDNICKAAGASRGLITHHFGSKDGLLAAVYAAAYQPLLAAIEPADGTVPELTALLDHMFSEANYSRDSLNVWLAIWGEAATNPAVQAEHRALYGRFRKVVAASIRAHGEARGLRLDPEALAAAVIGLVDGLWLEASIDPAGLSPERARAAALLLLEPVLGHLRQERAA